MDDKDEWIKLFWGGVIGLILFIAIISLTVGWSAIFGRELGKFNEETRRQIQEESRAYQTGTAQNLDKLCLEWDRTGNPAIAQSIRHRSADFKSELPQHIQECVDLARKVK